MTICVLQPNIDFPNLVQLIQGVESKNPMAKVRENNINNPYQAFLEIFPDQRLLNFGFFISGITKDNAYALAVKTDLTIYSQAIKSYILVSGNLLQWKNAFIECTQDTLYKSLIRQMNDIFLEFERLGITLCQKRKIFLEGETLSSNQYY